MSDSGIPSKHYLELLGEAIYVFNVNTGIITDIMIKWRMTATFDELVAQSPNDVLEKYGNYVHEVLGGPIFEAYTRVIDRRNLILHSFPRVEKDQTILAARNTESEKDSLIDENFLKEFISMNGELKNMLIARQSAV